MATERQQIKKVDGEKKALGIYLATFVTSGTVVECDIRKIPGLEGYDEMLKTAPLAARLAMHGMVQKLDDSAAGEDEPEAIEEIKATFEMLTKGDWTSRVQGEGIEGGMFARAWMQVKGVSLADAKTAIGQLVEKNFKANVDALKAAGKAKEAEKLTEKQVYNAIRDAALARHLDLNEAYEALKAKRKVKAKAKTQIEVEV